MNLQHPVNFDIYKKVQLSCHRTLNKVNSFCLIKDMGKCSSFPITNLEIRAYVGLVILFGALKKKSVEIAEIWCPGDDHHSHWATAAMP